MSLSTRITTWRKYPICILGYDIRRWEEVGGVEHYLPAFAKKFLFMRARENEALIGGPTHLQYNSPFGFLLTWPLCLHVWFQFHGKRTMVDTNGITETIPGSEKVFYWRFGARWEAEQDVYVVPSWYGPGLHWD